MLRLRAGAQLQHISQYRHPASLPTAKDAERGGHGLGARIVTVLDDGVIPCRKNLLPALHGPERGQGLTDFHNRHLQQTAHGNGRQSVAGKMDALQGHGCLEIDISGMDVKSQMFLSLDKAAAPHLALRIFHTKVDRRPSAAFPPVPQQRLVAIQNQMSLRPQALQDLHLGFQDSFPGAQILNVHGADVGDDRNVRLGNGGQVGHFPKVVHAHLQHRHLHVRLHGQNRHGHTDVVVVIDGRFSHLVFPGQHGGHHLLGGAFAHGAGDAYHRNAQSFPFLPGNLTQGLAGIRHHNGRIISVTVTAQHRRRAFIQRHGNEFMAVPLSAEGQKQLAGSQLSGVVVCSQECNVFIFGIDATATPLGSLLQCNSAHWALPLLFPVT